MDDSLIQFTGEYDLVLEAFGKIPEGVENGIKRAMFRSSEFLKKESFNNAPISPTQAQARAERKRMKALGIIPKKKKKGEKKKRVKFKGAIIIQGGANAPKKKKKEGEKRELPGGLRKSIEAESKNDSCSVFVAKNSYGGKYAHYIHDMKGKLWFMRGAGTKRQGARADARFIERAFNDNEDKVNTIISEEVDKGFNL